MNSDKYPISSFVLMGIWLVLILSGIFYLNCAQKPTQPDTTPKEIQITAPITSIPSGSILQLTATASLLDGSTDDVTEKAIWSNRPGRAGIVQEAGLFTAFIDSLGKEIIQADYQGQTATFEIEVIKRPVSLSIWPSQATIRSGESLQFEAAVMYQDASQIEVTDQVVWSVDPGNTGTIYANGLFQSVPEMTGSEIITARFQNLTQTSRVRVLDTSQLPIETVTIPEGSYVMGDDLGWANEKPAHTVFIDAFEIGKYEVTNEQYVRYLNAALLDGTIMVSSGIVTGRMGPFDALIYFEFNGCLEFPDEFIRYVEAEHGLFEFEVVPGFEKYPVVRLNWYGATAFCQYYGFRLPTEAEWEKACRGGEQFQYGTENGDIQHDLVNYLGIGGRDTYEGLAPVGSFPPNPYGLYDMSGNAAEYVFDAYDRYYYEYSPAQNPTGPGPPIVIGELPDNIAIWRGGSWFSYPFYCRSAYRGIIEDTADHSYLHFSTVGFRVARSLN